MTEKRFNVFDVDGTIFLEDHKEGSYHIGEIGNVDVNCLNDIAYRLNELHEENEQLKDDCKNWEKSFKLLCEENKELLLKIAWADECGVEWNEEYTQWIGNVRMTKKRFTFNIDKENGYDEESYFCDGTNSFYVNNPEEIELFIKEINELVEINDRLKKSLKRQQESNKECSKYIEEVAKENQNNEAMIEFLDTENTQIINELKTRTQIQHQLETENRELKKKLLIYGEIAKCSNCKYQNYNWFEDGDEFEICEKGNNEQQMEYHICKEWEEFE